MNDSIDLRARLVSTNDARAPRLEYTLRWEKDTTQLDLDFDITNLNIIWPARLKVESVVQNVEDSSSGSEVDLATLDRNTIIPAWSGPLDPVSNPRALEGVERYFYLSNKRILRIWEGNRDDSYPATRQVSAPIRGVGTLLIHRIIVILESFG